MGNEIRTDSHILPRRTIEQNRRLWAIVGKLAKYVGGREAAEAMMRDLVQKAMGQPSTRLLSEGQMEEIISALNAILKHREKACAAPEPDELPTQRQMDTIEHLRKDLAMHPQGLRKLCQRIVKKPWPQTRAEAMKLQEALSAMLLRKIPREQLAQRIGKLLFLDESLTAWEKNFLEDLNRRLAHGERLFVGSLKKLKEIEQKQNRIGGANEAKA